MIGRAYAKRLLWSDWLLLGVLLLALSAPFAVAFVLETGSQKLGAFADVWNTTDAIQMYVDNKDKWPQDWSALAPYLSQVGGDISNGVSERVDVNFRVNVANPPEPGEWYVHLKKTALPGEEQTANERLRRRRVTLSPSIRSRD
ncbi:MAG TPA: hypothetical protein VGP63_02830 [Planctomycetaceae bacterium]|jgi:hypothetical protein|nr:hypothetical protein [Planctomycetaceae bacterium]